MRSLPLLLLVSLAGCGDLAQRADALTEAFMPAAAGIADAHQAIYGGRPYLTTDRPRPLTCIDLGGGVLQCR